MSADQITVAESVTRLVPNFSTERKMEVPADLPGVVIFLHGVNDPGASYESVETGLCQGVNERLDRPDLKAGRYGADYSAAKKIPTEELGEDHKATLDDPDTYLYQRDADDPKTRSLMIPFYWGYRAEPGEIKRDKNDDPTKLRGQYQDIFDNRLDRHFAKGGGFFANATNNLLEMYSPGFAKFIRHLAQPMLSNTQYMGKGPHRRYFVLAATRLAMLVSEIRRVSPDETITIMGHSQGTLITLLAQALLIDKGQRCADTVIMVDTPYSVLPKATPKGHDTLATLINIATAVTQAPHAQPPLSALRDSKTYGGRTGPRWSPIQGARRDKVGNFSVFPERDNRGKVYLYFCPDDTTVALDDVHGIGTYGVPNTLPDGKPAMEALQSVRFYQRLWTKRHRDGKPVLVGDAIQQTVLRAKGEPRYPGGWTGGAVASQAPIAKGEEVLINAEPLCPPYAPDLFGGEVEPGTPTQAGKDGPDDVSIRSALGNPSARFKWFKVRTSPYRVNPDEELARLNAGKEPGDQTSGISQAAVHRGSEVKEYVIYREETPNEIQERMRIDPKEREPNSYHSAVLRSPENQRWVTAMDIAIGQAHSLDDPDMREVLVAIADWKVDKTIYSKITKLPGWEKLSEETQALVAASFRYYDKGLFPPTGLVSLTPPSLVANAPVQGVGR
ncbi:DUF3274 domain-containing protein [Pseudomonas sp.]|uniref:T6SS effector phospholipase Tle3 domain-containing protein n=1 Tax=Pseudomonas sp. TaxID=306 RepID=UPI0028AFB517|nr:DUF3274 domain-containing protein [Pseudomonas sp.]